MKTNIHLLMKTKHFDKITNLTLTTTLDEWCYDCPHFTQTAIEAQRI